MFNPKKTPAAQELANNIARAIGRRGWATEKPLAVPSSSEDTIRWVVIIPGRGIALINAEGRITVASSTQLDAPASSFDHTTTEADAEQTLRRLPLP